MKSDIVIFTDLEGTILRDIDGKYDETVMFQFLRQINRLEKLEDATAQIHILSPMMVDQMKYILDELDEAFAKYNKTSGNYVSYIKSAIAIQDNYTGWRNIPNRMLLVKYKNLNQYGEEKLSYVESYMKAHKDDDIKKMIYMGNGANDVMAMQKIKSNNGIVICPYNSTDEVKKIATYKSNEEDLRGLVDGFSKLCQEVEKQKVHVSHDDNER